MSQANTPEAKIRQYKELLDEAHLALGRVTHSLSQLQVKEREAQDFNAEMKKNLGYEQDRDLEEAFEELMMLRTAKGVLETKLNELTNELVQIRGQNKMMRHITRQTHVLYMPSSDPEIKIDQSCKHCENHGEDLEIVMCPALYELRAEKLAATSAPTPKAKRPTRRKPPHKI